MIFILSITIEQKHKHFEKRQDMIWNRMHQTCSTRHYIQATSAIDPSHESHNVSDIYPTMHHFTEMCTHVHIYFTKWCIVGCGTGAVWDLCNRSIEVVHAVLLFVTHHFMLLSKSYFLYDFLDKAKISSWFPFCCCKWPGVLQCLVLILFMHHYWTPTIYLTTDSLHTSCSRSGSQMTAQAQSCYTTSCIHWIIENWAMGSSLFRKPFAHLVKHDISGHNPLCSMCALVLASGNFTRFQVIKHLAFPLCLKPGAMCRLTHWGQVMHICVIELGHHWFW